MTIPDADAAVRDITEIGHPADLTTAVIGALMLGWDRPAMPPWTAPGEPHPCACTALLRAIPTLGAYGFEPCDSATKATWAPGHDARYHGAKARMTRAWMAQA